MLSPFITNPRANPELRSLYEIILLPPKDGLQDYFLGAIRILSQYFPIKYCALFLRDAQKDVLRTEALYGVERENHPLTCSTQKGTMAKVLESREPMVIQDLNQEPLYKEMLTDQKQLENIQLPLLCIPLVTQEEPMGVFSVNPLYPSGNGFVDDFRFLSILSAIVSPSIRNYHTKTVGPHGKESRTKSGSHRLDEILEQKLVEVLNKIDPYVETKTKLGIFDDIIRLVEKILIQSALERVDHVQIAAAELLGINRNTLRKKMKELKIRAR